MPRVPFRSADELIDSKKRIYNHLRVLDRNVKPLPPLQHSKCLTLFIEPEDFLYYTFLCDENVGYIGKPSSKDPEHELFLPSHRLPILFYERDYMKEFLKFLKKSREEGTIDPVIYTSGVPEYTELMLNLIDPEKEIFSHVFHQNACVLLEKEDEKLYIYIKDI